MKKPQNSLVPITLRTALLLIPVIFIAVIFTFWATGRYLRWPSTNEQRTTAIYLAVAFSLLPVATYLLSFFSQNKASVGVKAFGTELTFDFTKNVNVVRQLEVPNNIFAPGTYGSIAHSGSEEIVRAISKATSSPVVTLNVRDGRAWWLTRLFALSAGAVHYGLPNSIVFVATKENIERTFIGWAEPRPIFESIIRNYPEIERQYTTSRAIFNQLSLFSKPEITPTATDNTGHTITYISLSPTVQNYQFTYDMGKEYSFLQILLDRLTCLEPSTQEPTWITITLLSNLFQHCWYTKAVDLKSPAEEQIKQVLDMQTSYIPLVEQGQFVGMMKSELAMKAIVKQVASL